VRIAGRIAGDGGRRARVGGEDFGGARRVPRLCTLLGAEGEQHDVDVVAVDGVPVDVCDGLEVVLVQQRRRVVADPRTVGDDVAGVQVRGRHRLLRPVIVAVAAQEFRPGRRLDQAARESGRLAFDGSDDGVAGASRQEHVYPDGYQAEHHDDRAADPQQPLALALRRGRVGRRCLRGLLGVVAGVGVLGGLGIDRLVVGVLRVALLGIGRLRAGGLGETGLDEALLRECRLGGRGLRRYRRGSEWSLRSRCGPRRRGLRYRRLGRGGLIGKRGRRQLGGGLGRRLLRFLRFRLRRRVRSGPALARRLHRFGRFILRRGLVGFLRLGRCLRLRRCR